MTELLDATYRVCGDVILERSRQDQKWGQQDHPDPFWYVILGEEVGEVGRAIFERARGSIDGYRELRDELIQVAAVAVAWVEALDRSEGV